MYPIKKEKCGLETVYFLPSGNHFLDEVTAINYYLMNFCACNLCSAKELQLQTHYLSSISYIKCQRCGAILNNCQNKTPRKALEDFLGITFKPNYYIAIDFDGTIVENMFPAIGQIVPKAFEFMQAFNKLGAKLILNTMRSDIREGNYLSDATRFIVTNKVELFSINRYPTQNTWTNSPKVYAHTYIDDANAGCPLVKPKGFEKFVVDWGTIGPKIIESLEQHTVANQNPLVAKGN